MSVKNTARIPATVRPGNAPVLERLRKLDRTQRHAVLATVAAGQPHASLIAFALAPDLPGIIFATPRDTAKYRNMIGNRRVAVLIDSRRNDRRGYLQAEAVTVIGTAGVVRRGRRRDGLARIFTRKHPDLAAFIAAPSTALILIDILHCYHVGGFQTVSAWHRDERQV